MGTGPTRNGGIGGGGGAANAWKKAPLYHAPDAALLAEDRDNGMDAAWVRRATRFDPVPETLVLLEPGADALAVAQWAPKDCVLGADPREVSSEELAKLADFDGRAVTVSTAPEHRRGAPPELEIAVALAGFLHVCRAMGDEAAKRHVTYRLEGERRIVDGIAKIKALRLLHAGICQRQDDPGEQSPAFVHSVTSWRTLTKADPHVNVMRATTQALAAGIAGADVITVLPFDTALGEPSERGRRLARNTHSILHQEAHLGRVADPAGGAPAIESRARELVLLAWAHLRRIEDHGGLETFTLDEHYQAHRDQRLRTRKLPITGVSEFPDTTPLLERAPAPPEDGLRDAREFEALRDHPPLRVHLRTLGPLREHKPRLDFARNFFRISGAEFVDDPKDAVACLCGADAAYTPAQVEELRAAGARKIVLAGQVELPGLGASIFRGCDVVATLEKLAQEGEAP